MKKKHDKILLAGQLLVEAANECLSATNDIGYAKSILLAGAVSLIVTPLLNECGIESLHENLAKGAIEFEGIDLANLPKQEAAKLVGQGVGYYRFAYNSLKHTGKWKVKASDDIAFFADLKEEAFHLIDAVIHDFDRLPSSESVVEAKLSPLLLHLLSSPWNFPAFDVQEDAGEY